jgi:hypothetical protein
MLHLYTVHCTEYSICSTVGSYTINTKLLLTLNQNTDTNVLQSMDYGTSIINTISNQHNL